MANDFLFRSKNMTEYSHLTGKYEGNLFVCFKGYKLFFTTAQIFMALWKSHQ